MVDMEGNIEEHDIDYIAKMIESNGDNISNSIDRLTKELRMCNQLKIIELELNHSFNINYKGLSKTSQKIIAEYLEW